MPHIHTEPGQHDHTASGYIIRVDLPEPALVLHRHKILGVYMQFGGHVELNETPWQAAAHEVQEESGYELSQLKILQPKHTLKTATGIKIHPVPACYMTHPFNDTHYHTDAEYAFTTTEPPAHPIGENESLDIRTFTAKEIGALSSKEMFANTREVSLYILEVILKEWEPVDTSSFAL